MLPMRNSPRREPSEYPLDELDPRPDDALLEEEDDDDDDEPPRARLRKSTMSNATYSQSPGSWTGRASSVGSSSKQKFKPMFAGPPPPIAKSIIMSKSPNRGAAASLGSNPFHGLATAASRINNSFMFDRRQETPLGAPDSVWRGLRRQEKALEEDVQELLDFQASGLVAGSQGLGTDVTSDSSERSDAGSSTPTGTFYSTATSKSRMVNSLHIPTRATAEGNVIPVRQPPKGRPMGLRSARAALQQSLDAFVDLKREEDAYVDAALSERKKALVHLSRLGTRKDGIETELHTLEDDADEPLGRELRELGTKYDSLTEDIRALEEKLVGMRNRRRRLKEKMDDVRSRREAGLSGYRGALKDVDSEVKGLLRRPPVPPLDAEMLSQDDGKDVDTVSIGGAEFLRLVPERRTLDMARSWWESEILILERRKSRIDRDRQALEEGGAVWREVTQLVTGVETNLRRLMKTGRPASTSSKGKDHNTTTEDLITEQLHHMDEVLLELEHRMQLAESKNWNLLICAIGAELEAFRTAHGLLRELVGGPPSTVDKQTHDGAEETPTATRIEIISRENSHSIPGHEENGQDEESSDNEVPADLVGRDQGSQDESDNEVPPDLLVSHYEEQPHEPFPSGLGLTRPMANEDDGEDGIPSEFKKSETRIKSD
ncbi:hypothetical protein S40293_06299 [Stachybotrys chartarum IBT 40293]|nr:hypothetical protein S40293_06299 [Stachybotrys chartarum IBT 40293]